MCQTRFFDFKNNRKYYSKQKAGASDQTLQAEGSRDFFESLGKAAKKGGLKQLNKLDRALEIATNKWSAAASEKP